MQLPAEKSELFFRFLCGRTEFSPAQESQELWAELAQYAADAIHRHIQLDGDVRQRYLLDPAHEEHPTMEITQACSQFLDDREDHHHHLYEHDL
jgi:hypothetical protein